MGICRPAEQGGHGGDCTTTSKATRHFGTRPFVSRQVPRTTDHSARACQTTDGLAGCLAVRLFPPASHPSQRRRPQLKSLDQSKAHDSLCTNTRTHLRQDLGRRRRRHRRRRGGPHAGRRTWRLRPRLQQLQLPSLGLGSASRSCTQPLSGQRYLPAYLSISVPNTGTATTTLVDALTYFVLLCSALSCAAHAHVRTHAHVHARPCSLTNVPVGPSHFEGCVGCAVLYCTVCCTGPSRLNSSAVSPTPGPCDRPIHLRRHCGDFCVAVDTVEAATHPPLIRRPSRRRTLRQLGFLDQMLVEAVLFSQKPASAMPSLTRYPLSPRPPPRTHQSEYGALALSTQRPSPASAFARASAATTATPGA